MEIQTSHGRTINAEPGSVIQLAPDEEVWASAPERGPLDDVFKAALDETDALLLELQIIRARIQAVREVFPGYRALNPEVD